MKREEIMSPRMRKLYDHIKECKDHGVCLFLEEVKACGGPLIEEIDENNVMVTFLYEGEGKEENVVVYGAFPGYRYEENMMERLLNSNLWFRSYKVRNDIKFGYNFSVNDKLDDDYSRRSQNCVLDVLNPNTVVFPKDEEDEEDEVTKKSLVTLSKVNRDKWTGAHKNINQGEIELHRFKSDKLNNTRRVWVYKPYGYENKTMENNLVILTDGFIHTKILNAKDILDNLMSKGAVSNSLCVFIDNTDDRYEELTCSETFGEFITEEIVPWVYKNYNVSRESQNTIIGGLSLGGLSAAYMGLKYSDIFGKVLAQSPSFWWNEEWLIDKYMNNKKLPLKFYFNVGILEDKPYDDEPIMRECIDKMRDVLVEKGYEVFYETFPSGHDYLCWGEKLACGLIALNG